MSQYLSLDWRQAPTTSETVGRIQRFLTDLDATNKARIRLSDTRGKSPIGLVERDGSPPMILRTDAKTTRRAKGQVVYWARFYSMAMTICGLLMDRQQVMARFVEYKEVDPRTRMTMAQAKRVLYDLALTIEVHPLALGVIPESTAQVWLPPRVTIVTTTVTDVVGYHSGSPQAQFLQKARLESEKTESIPALLREIKVVVSKKKKEALRAVLVVEHRNLKKILTEHEFAPGGVILVMTSGYPSSATKEFLHMLCKDEALQQVPFFYFSDHDLQGFQIYQVLKYGAQASAWASEIMVCPRLTWVGPSKDELLKSPTEYRESFKAQYEADFPHKAAHEVSTAVEKWETNVTSSINRKFVKVTKSDRGLVRGFERLGWLKHEPKLSQEIELMLKTPSKFRLADLAQVNPRYVRIFLASKIDELSPIKARAKAQPVAVRSPIGERYKQLPSQVSSMPLEQPSELGEEEAAKLVTEELL